MSRSLPPRPTAEPAEAATEVEDGEAVQVRQQGTQIRPFRSRVQALDRAREAAVTPIELLIVVDVLRHSAYSDIDGSRRRRRALGRSSLACLVWHARPSFE